MVKSIKDEIEEIEVLDEEPPVEQLEEEPQNIDQLFETNIVGKSSKKKKFFDDIEEENQPEEIPKEKNKKEKNKKEKSKKEEKTIVEQQKKESKVEEIPIEESQLEEKKIEEKPRNTKKFFNSIEEKNKARRKKVLIFILTILVLLGIGMYIAYDKGYLDKILKKDVKTEQNINEDLSKEDSKNIEEPKEETTEEQKIVEEDLFQEEEQNQQNNQSEVKNRKLVEQIANKIEILSCTTKNYVGVKAAIFERNLQNKTLSEELKIYSILWYAYSEMDLEELSKEELTRVYSSLNNGKKAPSTLTEDVIDEYSAYSYKDINEVFKSLYGYDINTANISIKGPIFAYDSVSKKFIQKDSLAEMDGEEYYSFFESYLYELREDSNKLYAYISFVYYDNDTYAGYGLIYKDYNKKELYKKMSDDDISNFEIDESNYNDFSKYKLTFTKSGSNYIFDSIQLIK